MPQIRSKKPELAKKIATLQLSLAPLVPLPSGDAHPAFPQTLLAYHLLTEDELDSIAHHYHQSTPGVWTNSYPVNMNYDKDYLRRPRKTASESRRQSGPSEPTPWLSQFMNDITQSDDSSSESNKQRRHSNGLTDAERIAIKRRKLGKFIGLIGMETPVAELEGRIRDSLERALKAAQEELKRAEEWDLRRKKMS